MVVLAVALVALVSGGCSDGGELSVTEPPPPTASLLVPAPPELRVKCQATADAVGYPVACSKRECLEGLAATPAIGRCELDIIGPGATDNKACGNAWRRWVVGSSETNDQHLVIVASPRPLRRGCESRQWAGLVSGRSCSPSPFADDQRVADTGRLRPGEDQRRKRLHAPRRLDLDSSWSHIRHRFPQRLRPGPALTSTRPLHEGSGSSCLRSRSKRQRFAEGRRELR